MIALFTKLLMGHALADFALQSDAMARGKNRNRPVDPASVPPGQTIQTVWPYWLTAHALIHGGVAALIVGNVGIGLYVAVTHWAIDLGKCEGGYGIHMDQFLHMVILVSIAAGLTR